MKIKLYRMEASPTTRAVAMTLEALKLNYETQNVDLTLGENKTPEYLEKNPAHTIPMIEDDDFALADSHAIITYLASKYGGDQSKLYPSDLKTRATVIQRLFFEATVLYKASYALVYAVVLKGQPEPTPQQIEDVIDSYDVLDKYLQKTKFVACDYVTIADISCVASISSTDLWVPIDAKFTNLHAWWNTLKNEDWYIKGNVPGLNKYKEFMDARTKKASGSA